MDRTNIQAPMTEGLVSISRDEYATKLWLCLTDSHHLREQAEKHFLIFGRGTSTVGSDAVTQTWVHLHARLQLPCGPGALAYVQRLYEENVGPRVSTKVNLPGFVELYLEMLNALTPALGPVPPALNAELQAKDGCLGM